MALITGGLGGLGVLATYELAAAGTGFVVTTSRSGRIASGQPELVQMQENLRMMCTHYSARIDGCDIGALSDLFQWIQRPDNQAEDLDLFATCVESIDKNPNLLGRSELAKIQKTREHLTETCDMLEEIMKMRLFIRQSGSQSGSQSALFLQRQRRAAPGSVHSAIIWMLLLLAAGAHGQQLDVEDLLPSITSELPSANDLSFTIGGQTIAGVNQDMLVVAGVDYPGLLLAASTGSFGASLSGVARLRVVRQDTPTLTGGCSQADFYRPGGLGFSNQGILLAVDGNGDLISSASKVSFMLGGNYRLCYSYDGTFSGPSSSMLEVPDTFKIKGARLDCATDRCFEEYTWRCFVYSDASAPAGSCVLRFDALELLDATAATRLWWGPPAGVGLSPPGSPTLWTCGSHTQVNASTSSAPLLPGPHPPITGTLGREFVLPALASSSGFSVQACFCPIYDGLDAGSQTCDTATDFVQLVGRVHFFSTRSCDDILCTNVFATAAPSSPFVLQVNCGGAGKGCSFTTANRIKVIDYSELGTNDLPAWSDSAGCRTSLQSADYLKPKNCAPGTSTSCGGDAGEVNGGATSDVKAFRGLTLGPYFTSGVPMPRWYDICYCDADCNAAGSFGFHKVGRVRVEPLQLMAMTQSGSDTGLQAVGLLGDIMVSGARNVPLSPTPAQMKLLWDNSRTASAFQCAGLANLVSFLPDGVGPTCAGVDSCSYKASKQSSFVTIFNDGGLLGERLRFLRAGIVAVCYCGVLADGSGSQPAGQCLRENEVSYWSLMVRTVVRGPCKLLSAGGLCQEQEWSFYTGLPFRLELLGLGLRSTDKLRIIPAIDSCRGNPDGGGEPTVFSGGPSAFTSLSMPDSYIYGGGAGKDDVDIQISTSNAHDCGVMNDRCRSSQLLEILPINGDHVIWRFGSDPGLRTGDFVVLDDVSGGSPDQNALVAGKLGLEHVGHQVTRQGSETEASAAAKAGLLFRLPLALGLGALPRFSPGNGKWHRHSAALTREELKATVPKEGLQVCWGSGPDTYYARAGKVNFNSPQAMSAASVSLTTIEGGRWAPAVLSFKTAVGGAAAMRYKSAPNSMRLRLYFEDVAKLEPLGADADGNVMPSTAPADRDQIVDAKQFICGSLFQELWSSDSKGFPLPKGCYFGSLFGGRRELNVLFEPKNGLEAGKEYQLVMNLRVATSTSSANQVLSIWAMDDVLLSPYGVVEMGSARLARNPQPASGIGEPRFMGFGGFFVLDEAGAFRDLLEFTADPGSFLFRLQGDPSSRIRPGSVLRIFMRPFTVWDLRATCQAQCFPHQSRVCGTISSCVGDSVVAGGQRNIVKLTLPADMTEIYGATVQHTVRVTGLKLPMTGFFGTRLAAQVSLEDDTRVHFTESSGAYVWKAPKTGDQQSTTASVVVIKGDGNDMPFKGDLGNTLYVRFLLGASLFSELKDGDSSLKILLPRGYFCRAADAAPETLNVFAGEQPQGRGTLASSSNVLVNLNSTGTWSFDGQVCMYRLKAGEMVPAGTQVMLRLTVDHADEPMKEADLLNSWSLQLFSKGWYRRQVQTVAAAPFQAVSGNLNFGTAVAVLGKLVQECIQPSTFVKSSRNNVLSVFFRPEQTSGYQGQIIITGPPGFNFAVNPPDQCRVTRLPDIYYRVGGGRQYTQYLPLVLSCTSACSEKGGCVDLNFNRALVGITNSLLPTFVYGFQLDLFNKAGYDVGDENLWSIATTDELGRLLDASYPRTRLNPATGGANLASAWGVQSAAGQPSSVQLTFTSLRPSSAVGGLSSLTMYPIKVPTTFTTSCRLMSPDGWAMSPLNFVFHYASIPGATASWPGLTPWQSSLSNSVASGTSPYVDQPKNVLLWEKATYLSSERYGFIVQIGIPMYPVATMSSSFILEFGWDATSLADRPLAYVLPSPQVEAVTNFVVDYQSNLISQRQRVSVVLETSVTVPKDGVLRLQAPEGFAFEELCNAEAVPGELALPEEASVTCRASAILAADGSPTGTLVSLQPRAGPLPSGRLAFGLSVRNPSVLSTNRGGRSSACGAERCWVVEALDASGSATQAAAQAPSFAVNRLMPQAKILDLTFSERLATDRNDRPGRANNLIFAFSLSERPASAGKLVLSGPYGFVFDEDCLPGFSVVRGPGGVFLDLPGGWMPGYAVWEAAARVRSCVSSGSRAVLQVELGLRASRLYAFRIRVASNPLVMPEPNLWTIEYAGESCTPFQGFSPWMFRDISLTPTSTSRSDEANLVPNPLVLLFRPFKEVGSAMGTGAGGLLRITGPSGFRAATKGTSSSVCQDFSVTNVASGAIFLPGVDLQCQAQNSQDGSGALSYTFVGDKKLDSGQLYQLVAQFINPLTVISTTASWSVTTFIDASGSLESELDDTVFPGFAVNPRFSIWRVTAPAGEQHAGAIVTEVEFELSFSSKFDAGGQFLVRGPEGFVTTSPPLCSSQVGSVLGGYVTRVGHTADIQQCAMLIWELAPEAVAASRRLADGDCLAHMDIRSLELCDSPDPASKECSFYEQQVCNLVLPSKSCHNFRFKAPTSLKAEPSCKGREVTYKLVQGESIMTGEVVRFAMNTRNPTKDPRLNKRFWEAYAYTRVGGPLAFSALARGWSVIPRFQNALARLTGLLLSSGSLSSLTLDFSAPVAADEVRVSAVAPVGFDFRAAKTISSDSGGLRNVTDAQQESVSIRCSLMTGQRLDLPLIIENVRLGKPGAASFNVAAFLQGIKVTESLEVSGPAAFTVPGRISVESGLLNPIRADVLDQRLPDELSSVSLFGPRGSDTAIAAFVLRFGAPVTAKHELVISAAPFIFLQDGPFTLKLLDESGFETGTVAALPRWANEDGTLLRVALFGPLFVQSAYSLKIAVKCGPLPDNGERWLFEARPALSAAVEAAVAQSGIVSGELPLGTNDAQFLSFPLVRMLALTVEAGRVPPRSDADIVVTVDTAQSLPRQLLLYAPMGFSFGTGTCLRDQLNAQSKVLSCRREGTQAHVALLQLSRDGLQGSFATALVVAAPDSLEIGASGNSWLMRAIGTDGLETGWGSTAGFAVMQMRQARVAYGGTPSAAAHMAVVFSTSHSLLGGGMVNLQAPAVYKLSCSATDGYTVLSFPGVQSCDGAGVGLRLYLNQSLAPGDYAFIMGVTNPAFTPALNSFSLMLVDRNGRVADARVGFSGHRIMQGLYLKPPILEFSSSVPNAEAEVRVTLRVTNQLDPLKALGALRAVQIAVPDRFTLIVREPVQNLDGLPTPENGWYHLFFVERLVRIDIVESATTKPRAVPAGDYRLSFKVRLPEFWMPNVNVWLLSLCRDLSCTDLIATVPIAGFAFGDRAVLQAAVEGTALRNAAARRFGLEGARLAAVVASAWMMV
ncbi:unnamed protein product [Polarella glacialis]|uniref:Uncharacterized protein n=1 Tax=Polarella glacialis TaxID=89957 RepID=A0A813GV43_POLGL|nr:unnamed protein product [Polarella glacialis]